MLTTYCKWLATLAVGMVLLLLAGCEREKAQAQGNQQGTVPLGKCIIRGQVKIVGWDRPVKMLSAGMNGKTFQVPDESVVVNANGTLTNVIVYLKDAPACAGDISKPVILDQAHCRYVPHVVALMVGQTLRVKNNDPTPHNVNMISDRNPAQNLSMPDPGYQDVIYRSPEIMQTKCDVHPWMSAYIGVFSHPFFAVTGDDGAFEIKGVPAGTYTLVAWQERFDELRQEVTVGDDKPAEVSFTYAPPK